MPPDSMVVASMTTSHQYIRIICARRASASEEARSLVLHDHHVTRAFVTVADGSRVKSVMTSLAGMLIVMLHAIFLDRRVQGNRIVYALLVVDAFIGVEVSTLVGQLAVVVGNENVFQIVESLVGSIQGRRHIGVELIRCAERQEFAHLHGQEGQGQLFQIVQRVLPVFAGVLLLAREALEQRQRGSEVLDRGG